MLSYYCRYQRTPKNYILILLSKYPFGKKIHFNTLMDMKLKGMEGTICNKFFGETDTVKNTVSVQHMVSSVTCLLLACILEKIAILQMYH